MTTTTVSLKAMTPLSLIYVLLLNDCVAVDVCLGLMVLLCLFRLFDLILYVPSTIFQSNRDGSSWVEPVLS